MNANVITVTSKGQIAIPVSVRKELSIESGDKLVVYTYGDLIMLKVLKVPDIEKFRAMAKEAQEHIELAAARYGKIGQAAKDILKKIKDAMNE